MDFIELQFPNEWEGKGLPFQPGNTPSQQVAERIGLSFERATGLSGGSTSGTGSTRPG